MDLCQVGLATGADIDEILYDGTVPIEGSHPGQHLSPSSIAGNGNIDWSIRHLCVQGEGRKYIVTMHQRIALEGAEYNGPPKFII